MAIAIRGDVDVFSVDQTPTKEISLSLTGVVPATRVRLTGIDEGSLIGLVLLAPRVAPINLLPRIVPVGSRDPSDSVVAIVTRGGVVTVPVGNRVDSSIIGLVQKIQEPV